MKYIIFVSREIWPAFNSIYAYTKLKGEFPSKIVLMYTEGEIARTLEKKIKVLYREHGRYLNIQKIKIDNSIEKMNTVLKDIVEEGDILDITGARKSMLLALMDIKNVKIVYLMLRDMRFSKHPFMMRPLSLQEFSEVQR